MEESMFQKGDLIVFNKNNILMCGIIVGYYKEDNCYWYNITCGAQHGTIFTYRNGGDIGEFDILEKLDKNKNWTLYEKILSYIDNGEWNSEDDDGKENKE